jgi:hypothetical protein
VTTPATVEHAFDWRETEAERLAREEFLAGLAGELEALVGRTRLESQRIGGEFRGPGIRANARDLIEAAARALRRTMHRQP